MVKISVNLTENVKAGRVRNEVFNATVPLPVPNVTVPGIQIVNENQVWVFVVLVEDDNVKDNHVVVPAEVVVNLENCVNNYIVKKSSKVQEKNSSTLPPDRVFVTLLSFSDAWNNEVEIDP